MYFCQVLICFILLNIIHANDFEDNRKPLIINGDVAVPGEYKYMVALFHKNDFICGGSIIGKRTVLTAAHCLAYGTGDSYRWYQDYHGIANLNKSASAYKMEFSNATFHPEYNGVDSDIAIFTTTTDIPFDSKLPIKPVCIHRYHIFELPYFFAYAMGWGKTSRDKADNEYPDILRYVKQRIEWNKICAYENDAITDSKICADRIFTPTGICSGDSGGPLVHYGIFTSPVQIGVASYINKNKGCAGGAPDVYTRVSYFAEWIKRIANDSIICYI